MFRYLIWATFVIFALYLTSNGVLTEEVLDGPIKCYTACFNQFAAPLMITTSNQCRDSKAKKDLEKCVSEMKGCVKNETSKALLEFCTTECPKFEFDPMPYDFVKLCSNAQLKCTETYIYIELKKSGEQGLLKFFADVGHADDVTSSCKQRMKYLKRISKSEIVPSSNAATIKTQLKSQIISILPVVFSLASGLLGH